MAADTLLCIRIWPVLALNLVFLEMSPPAGTQGPPPLWNVSAAQIAGTAPVPQPTWLGNPAAEIKAQREGSRLHLSVGDPGRGMKWTIPLNSWPNLSSYKYLAVRYRARGVSAGSDYFIWLGRTEGGRHMEAQPMALSELQDDGAWHIAVAEIKVEFAPTLMALQLQARNSSRADLWIDGLTFSAERPTFPLADILELKPRRGAFPPGMIPVDLTRQADASIADALSGFGLTGWPETRSITTMGVPFLLPPQGRAVGMRGLNRSIHIPLSGTASEIYLLLAATLPKQDLTSVLGATPMRRFDTPERFVVRLTYATGENDEAFPIPAGAQRYAVEAGLAVYCVPVPKRLRLIRATLINRMESASFLLAGVTVNRGTPRQRLPFVATLPPPAPSKRDVPGPAFIRRMPGGYLLGNSLITLEVRTLPGIGVGAITNRCLHAAVMGAKAGALFELECSGKRASSLDVRAETASICSTASGRILRIPFTAEPRGLPLHGMLDCRVAGADILMSLHVQVTGSAPVLPSVRFPVLRGLTLGRDTWYLWAGKTAILNHVPVSLRGWYGGEYPLQIADLFNPAARGGFTLATYDLKDIYKQWQLDKGTQGVDLAIQYFPREYRPGEWVETAPTAVRAHSGDWRQAITAYRKWLATWYRPQVPRKRWFQRCFNYRQYLAWTQLRRADGTWRMDEVIRKDRAFFGCIDYLHIFDFGESHIYGRVGDYNHYGELGGRDAMAAAIARAKQMGVPVGLYIEGYLCDERAQWGKENVLKYGIRKADGSPLLWAPGSTEHMMCPAASGWRSHLADTYRRVAAELSPSGMYIDQYGFADTWKVCYSHEHGHRVPAPPLRGEYGTLRAIRSATPAPIATLTEEVPCDVNSQCQDGSLGYSVAFSDADLTPSRFHLFRFVFPDFKVFQLVSYNDFVEGGWQLLKFPFFNGEGIWLQNAHSGFCADAHAFLEQAFAIQHEYADAFTSQDVEVLVPTLKPSVYANRFRSPRVTVWTLFNAEFHSVHGSLLRVPYRRGKRYVDAFSGTAVRPVRRGSWVELGVTLAPKGVGCIVEK
ncbi:MAG: DUF6259 domain-containing protein [Chthonomonadales bacterium]